VLVHAARNDRPTHFDARAPGYVDEIRLHEFQLEQIIQNLTANSIRYRSSEPVKIHGAAQWRDNGWLFSVADNRRNCPALRGANLWDLLTSSRRSNQGTGIGLATCQRIHRTRRRENVCRARTRPQFDVFLERPRLNAPN
jgi:light-regulated signal transduction histidine kinase (bacteriophytochrome)